MAGKLCRRHSPTALSQHHPARWGGPGLVHPTAVLPLPKSQPGRLHPLAWGSMLGAQSSVPSVAQLPCLWQGSPVPPAQGSAGPQLVLLNLDGSLGFPRTIGRALKRSLRSHRAGAEPRLRVRGGWNPPAKGVPEGAGERQGGLHPLWHTMTAQGTGMAPTSPRCSLLHPQALSPPGTKHWWQGRPPQSTWLLSPQPTTLARRQLLPLLPSPLPSLPVSRQHLSPALPRLCPSSSSWPWLPSRWFPAAFLAPRQQGRGRFGFVGAQPPQDAARGACRALRGPR